MPEEPSSPTPHSLTPISLLDYIYAILYSPHYRETYQEFLKIDFPRVPYPKDADRFQKLSAMGGILRKIHLLETVVPEQGVANFPIRGDNIVFKVEYDDGSVVINSQGQRFENVPPEVWEYYIGGYQPAQKWLKDRKGRKLEYADIEHYQKIVAALKQTIAMQVQIDA